jgi:hypothetical protein
LQGNEVIYAVIVSDLRNTEAEIRYFVFLGGIKGFIHAINKLAATQTKANNASVNIIWVNFFLEIIK